MTEDTTLRRSRRCPRSSGRHYSPLHSLECSGNRIALSVQRPSIDVPEVSPTNSETKQLERPDSVCCVRQERGRETSDIGTSKACKAVTSLTRASRIGKPQGRERWLLSSLEGFLRRDELSY